MSIPTPEEALAEAWKAADAYAMAARHHQDRQVPKRADEIGQAIKRAMDAAVIAELAAIPCEFQCKPDPEIGDWEAYCPTHMRLNELLERLQRGPESE